MKNRILYIITAFVLVGLTSCDDFLNPDTFSYTTDKQFTKNENYANLLLTGCYNGMQKAVRSEWAMTELRSDNARIYARNSGTSTFSNVLSLDIGSPNSLDEFVTDYWVSTYKNIDRCNVSIDVSQNLPATSIHRDRLMSEARFIRASHYFNLVRLYGPVFLQIQPTGNEEVESSRYAQRTSVDSVMAFVERELTEIIAIDSLPNISKSLDLGRVTNLAAKSLLAKVYMHHYAPSSPQYAKAIPLLKDVISRAGNPQQASDLVPYDKVFSIQNEMNSEIIFTIRFMAGNKGLGSTFANDYAPANSGVSVINGQGKSYNYPSNGLLAAYESNDLRQDISLAEGYTKPNGEYVTDDGEGNSGSARWVKKFFSQVIKPNDAENDFPVIRLGDVILLYCEAVNEVSGVTPEILNYYNMIRGRAGLTAKTAVEVPNSYTFRVLLRQERRVELAFENQRWFDLLRWGNAATTMNASFAAEGIYAAARYSPNFTENAILLPIPSIVFDINPSIPQNAGY